MRSDCSFFEVNVNGEVVAKCLEIVYETMQRTVEGLYFGRSMMSCEGNLQ